MYKQLIHLARLVFVLMAVGAVQAELQLVGNFDSLTGSSPDDQACAGALGGTWDTESEGTGSIKLVVQDGSQTVTVIGHSNGESPRAFGFNGISNTIDNSETGIAFFRFMLRAYTKEPRTYMGFNADASDDPIDTWNANDPTSIPAGVSWVDNGSGGLDLLTLDGETVLKTDLVRSQWYNIWMVGNNAADTFDFYLSPADAPAGKPTLPKPEDLVQAGIPFVTPTSDPLTGIIVANPGGGLGGQAERIYLDEVWWDGDQGLQTPTQAKKPQPANSTADVARDVVLTWRASPSATAHNVYFGESAEDIANARADDPLGVQFSIGQAASSFVPEILLDFGQTYYWRVDEVNALDPGSPYVGTVWRFEVEPVAFALTQANITVTASGSADGDQVPENTINGSGLDAEGRHGVEDETMWLSSKDANGAWIEYAFDQPYKMYDMQVWNHNSLNESDFGLGMKDVVVSHSTDGTTWTALADVNQFAQAPGQAGYGANTIIDLRHVFARHIRIHASSNWVGFIQRFGLSEVGFRIIPTTARLPQPESGTVDLDPTAGTLMNWRAGREAAQHLLYLSTDEQAVIDGTAQSMSLTAAEYLAMDLDIDATYYWRVDEINDVETPDRWPGPDWNFSTVEGIGVDDFEDYTNDSPLQVFQTWVDGLGYFEDEHVSAHPGNGTRAVVGFDIWSPSSPHYLGSIMEKNNPHGGAQCMPLSYRNGEAPYASEALRTFANPQDWTGNGVDSLGIWYRGSSAVDSFSYDSAAQTYSVIAAGGNILARADTFHFVYQRLTGNGEMVVKVESIDPVDPWSKAGVMIRQGLEAGSPHAFMAITPSKGVTFAWRKVPDGDTESHDVPGNLTPYWLKLVRSGGSLSAFMSADASTWESLGSTTVAMTNDVYIGMAVSSHAGRADTPCEAVFSNVSTSGGVAGGVFTEAASISEETLNQPERLYVRLADVAGKRMEVELDSAGTSPNDWTLGSVDLTFLSGQVDVANIKELAIGVGDGVAGSDGLIFIDDVYLFRVD